MVLQGINALVTGDLRQRLRRFHDNTIVFLMGCRIAAGVEGDTFLQALSKRWDGVRVASISPFTHFRMSA